MLSRVADAVYWASRYVERAENVARFVNVNLDLMLDSPSTQKPKWEPLVQTTGDHEWFYKHYPKATLDTVTQFLTFDRNYPNSIISSLIYARENARTVRDVISREMWQELNQLYLMVVEASKKPPRPEELSAFFERVKMSGIYYAGVTDATLSHGEVWHFSRMGRMIERADKTSRILDVKYYILLPGAQGGDSTVDQVGWTALLNSASALQMYRQQVHHIAPTEVAKFLLLNPAFPRSIRHCVHALAASLHAITGSKAASYSNEAERLVGRLRAGLDFADIHEIMEIGLHEYLDELQGTLNDVGAALQRRFFERL